MRRGAINNRQDPSIEYLAGNVGQAVRDKKKGKGMNSGRQGEAFDIYCNTVLYRMYSSSGKE